MAIFPRWIKILDMKNTSDNTLEVKVKISKPLFYVWFVIQRVKAMFGYGIFRT